MFKRFEPGSTFYHAINLKVTLPHTTLVVYFGTILSI